MKNQYLAAFLSIVAALSLPTFAGEVEVKWHEPDQYTDIRASNQTKASFRNSLFSQLDKHWHKMANKHLPEGMKLKVKVINLDLAGDVKHNFNAGQSIRVVKTIYWPSIEFEYQLFDGDKMIKADKVKLKDMAFMDRSNIHRSSSYYYDKRIITDWFTDEMQTMLANLQRHKKAVMS